MGEVCGGSFYAAWKHAIMLVHASDNAPSWWACVVVWTWRVFLLCMLLLACTLAGSTSGRSPTE